MSIVPSYSCTICVKKSQSDEEIDLTWPIPPIGTVGFRVKRTKTLWKQSQKYLVFNSFFSWKAQFASSDTHTIVSAQATFILSLKGYKSFYM